MREDTVREAINMVVDPCSAGRGVPIGLTDMGLVRDVRIRHHDDEIYVELDMRVTSPGCMFAVEFDAEIRRRLEDLGVARVQVQWDAEPDWDMDDIEQSARLRLQTYRGRLNEMSDSAQIPLTVLPVA